MCLAAAIFSVIFSSFYEENNVTSKKYNINFFKRLASEVGFLSLVVIFLRSLLLAQIKRGCSLVFSLWLLYVDNFRVMSL